MARLNRKYQQQLRAVRKKLDKNPPPTFIKNLEDTIYCNSDIRLKRLSNIQEITSRYLNLFQTLDEISLVRNLDQISMNEKLNICKAYQTICKDFENLNKEYDQLFNSTERKFLDGKCQLIFPSIKKNNCFQFIRP